jgi:hypothetical protein
MSATYWVLASDELITTMDPSLLPDGLRLEKGTAPEPARLGEWYSGSSHWYQFTDDGAPPGLDGKRVELILGRQGREPAKSVIIERRVLP